MHFPTKFHFFDLSKRGKELEMEKDLPGGDSKAADISIGGAVRNSGWGLTSNLTLTLTTAKGLTISLTRGNRVGGVQAACLHSGDGGVQIMPNGSTERRVGEGQDVGVGNGGVR